MTRALGLVVLAGVMVAVFIICSKRYLLEKKIQNFRVFEEKNVSTAEFECVEEKNLSMHHVGPHF